MEMMLDPATQARLQQSFSLIATQPDGFGLVAWSYLLRSWLFLAGLALVVVGTALIKPTISSIVGRLYAPQDPRRTFGFTLFMVGVWSGAFFANIIAGALGERLGWHYGFMSAAAGMAIGLAVWFTLSAKLLGDVGRRPDHEGSLRNWLAALKQLSPQERARVLVLMILSLFTIVYSIAFYQKAGLIHLLVSERVDRTVGGFEIPASWFLSISTGSFLVLAPVVGIVLGRMRRVPDAVASVSTGLAALACGYVVLLVATTTTAFDGTLLPMAWIVVAYVFFGLADVFIWPPQLAAVTALAPRSMTSFMVGIWYVTVGAGTYIAGLFGAWAHGAGTASAFAVLLAMLALASTGARVLRPWMLARAPLAPAQLPAKPAVAKGEELA
jgi:POT family proton-dependent oligopeptide transporter